MKHSGFPIPIGPQDDELLSSYLTRVAHAHGSKPSAFCHAYIGKRQIWNVDLDRTANPALLDSVAAISGLTQGRVREMTLADYEEILSAGPRRKGKGIWVLATGSFHQLRRRHWLQYCPLCLEEDIHPFFRRMWRLAFVVRCERHGIPLRDSCPACDAPLAPHRAPPGGITICPFCWASLCRNGAEGSVPYQLSVPESGKSEAHSRPQVQPRGQGKAPAVNPAATADSVEGKAAGVDSSDERLSDSEDDISSPLTEFQRLAISALHAGHAVIGNSTIPAEEYFSILRSIASALTASNPMQRMCSRFDVPDFSPKGHDRHEIELSRYQYRVGVLRVLVGLVSGWPDSFDAGAASAGLTQRSFRHEGVVPPSLNKVLVKLSPGIARWRPIRVSADGASIGAGSTGDMDNRRTKRGTRRRMGGSKFKIELTLARLKAREPKGYRTARAELLLSVVSRAKK